DTKPLLRSLHGNRQHRTGRRCTECHTHRRRKLFEEPDEALLGHELNHGTIDKRHMDEEGNKYTYEVHAQLLDGSAASLCKSSCNEYECADCRKVFHDRHYNPHDNFIGLFKQFVDSTDFIFDGNHRNTDEDGKCNDLQHIVSRHGIENICRNDVDQCLVECLLYSSTGFSAFEFGVAVF